MSKVLSTDERNRYVISLFIAIIILFFIGFSISSSLPNKSEAYQELENIVSPINGYSTEIDNWKRAKNVLIDFNYWYEVLERFEQVEATNNDVESLEKSVKRKISKLQIKLLPKIRKYYAAYLNEKPSFDNYKVEIASKGRNRIIIFTNKSLTSRRRIEQLHLSVVSELKVLGFKQIRYKWSDESRYVRYEFDDYSDFDLRAYNLKGLEI